MSEKRLYFPEDLNQTKPCVCGKVMILCETGYRNINPSRIESEWKCFGCGVVEKGPNLYTRTIEEVDRLRWEQINKE